MDLDGSDGGSRLAVATSEGSLLLDCDTSCSEQIEPRGKEVRRRGGMKNSVVSPSLSLPHFFSFKNELLQPCRAILHIETSPMRPASSWQLRKNNRTSCGKVQPWPVNNVFVNNSLSLPL